MRPRAAIVATVLAVIASGFLFPHCRSGRSRPPRPLAGAGLRGSIYTVAAGEPFVLVPGFEVFLRNTGTGAVSNRVRTDVFGRYAFRRQGQATYRLCWDAPGWIPGCAPHDVTIGLDTKHLPPAEVRPRVTATTGPVIGRVTQGDGGSPWFAEPFFGIDQTATVSALSPSGAVVASARTNFSGQFVLPAVPRNAGTLQATAGNAVVRLALTPDTNRFLSMTFPNQPPRIRSVTLLADGQPVRETEPGTGLEVVADVVDADGDPVTLEWKTAPGDGEVLSDQRTIWQLPREPGRNVLYLLAADGKGGFAKKQIQIDTGLTDARFGGRVLEGDGKPVDGAAVAINGRVVAESGRDGTFTTRAARAPSYVVTVTKRGFATASRIYDHGDVRDVYRLVRAQTRAVDPRAVIDLTDQRATFGQQSARGVRLTLPANALVDAGGRAPAGNLTSAIATLDIANGEMPGNFGAIVAGRETSLVSFGAMFTEFTDASGRRYNLRPGTTARMTLPVPEAMLRSAPAEIVLWSYDEATGFWNDDAGKARLDRNLGAYVGEVRHFSTINTDIELGAAACLKVSLDASVPAAQVKIRLSYDSGPTVFAQTPELLLDEADNAMFRLPPNDDVKIRVFDVSTDAEIGSAVVLDNGTTPAPNNVVNLGGATTPEIPSPPYANCRAVTIRLDVPAWAGAPGSPFLTFAADDLTGSEAAAVLYYSTLDPGLTFNSGTQTWSGGTRATLGDWWSVAGFGPNGEDNGGTRAAYMNYKDLGFGRDMHIRANGGDVFAYVTNYGNPDQDPANADLALAADHTIAKATVCMEYTTQPGFSGRIVKFFVYDGGLPTSKLLNSANLDGYGEKFVPNLCQNCHGGEFFPPSPSAADVSLRPAVGNPIGASFREFDVTAFRYPGGAVVPDAATLQALFDLNQLVKLSDPQPAIVDLIDGWYAAAAPAQDSDWTPPAWQTTSPGHTNLYRQVVAQSCRTCHVAFNRDQTTFGINWTTWDQFLTYRGSIEPMVCGSSKYMPHALITYRNFWLSTGPHQPAVLRDFSDPANGWAAFGTCQ